MSHSVPDICDAYIGEITVLDPQFRDFGGRRKFGGEIVTIRCFEDNSLVAETVRKPGNGRVIVVDGGGSLRRALLGDSLAAALQTARKKRIAAGAPAAAWAGTARQPPGHRPHAFALNPPCC